MASEPSPDPDRNRDHDHDPENYQVLARRFRPRNLDEVVGQQAILETLRGALQSARVPHAFLFSGSRGVGKTTLARILARCLNCEVGASATPCGTCAMCVSILQGNNGDVMEIDAASHNKVEDIRALRDRVGFVSMGSRYKIYILDEVHMLTTSAFNAFLKTLEEPPPNVVFILATTELHKIPDTIRSRCQVLLFESLGESDIVQRLQMIAASEGVDLATDVLAEIARGARGGMRDSETALERILPVAREKGAAFGVDDFRRLMHRTGLAEVTDVVASLLRGESAPAMHFVADLVGTGVDEREVLGEILEVLRAILLLKVDGPESGLVAVGGELRQLWQQFAEEVDLHRLDAMMQAGLLGRERIRRVDDRRLILEISMLRMAEAGRLPQLAELLEQVRSGGAIRGAVPGAVPGADSRSTATVPVAHEEPPPPAAGSLHERLIAVCGERRSMLVRTLEHCQVAGPGEADTVRIVVATERKLHRDRMTSKGVQEELKTMLAELLGRPVQLEVTMGDAGPVRNEQVPSGVSGRRRGESGASAGEGVRKVQDRFDGRIVEVDRPRDGEADREADAGG